MSSEGGVPYYQQRNTPFENIAFWVVVLFFVFFFFADINCLSRPLSNGCNLRGLIYIVLHLFSQTDTAGLNSETACA